MRLIAVSIIFIFCINFMDARSKDTTQHDEVASLYKNIGQNLALIKQNTPASCAHKISSVLDDVDRMYNATHNLLKQDHASIKELEIRTLESTVLQKELLLAKQESEELKQSLQEKELTIKKTQAQVSVLKEQNSQLLTKKSSDNDLISAEISKLDKQLASGFEKEGMKSDKKNSTAKELPESIPGADTQKIALDNKTTFDQNLNLTSTSEPSSPR